MSARLTLITYLLLAPLISVQIRYLTFHYDHLTLWFYRYLFGALVMALILAVFKRRLTVAFFKRPANVGVMLIVAAIICVESVLMSEGIKHTNTATASLFGTIMLPISCLIASVLDRERGVELLRNPMFIASWLVIVLATLGFSLEGSGGGNGEGRYLYGVCVLFVNLMLMAVTSFLFKKALNEYDAWIVSGVTIILCFLIMALARWGCEGSLVVASGGCEGGAAFVILCFSGVYGILVGCGMRAVILKRVGVVVCSVIGLAVPVVTAIMGYLLLREKLSLTQIVFGSILLCAGYVCLGCRRQENGRIAEEDRKRERGDEATRGVRLPCQSH